MQYAPTRVREKSVRFHISVSGHAQNAPNFTLPNKDTPKNRPVLDANPWRRTFRGVCFCALHGYTQNLAGFIPPYTDKPKTHPVLDPNHRRRTFRGVCFCALHEYVKNLAGFRPKPSARNISGRMLLRPTRVHTKFGGFHTSLHG